MTIVEELTALFENDKQAIRAIILKKEEDFDTVDELMQDTFLKAWEDRDSFGGDSKLLTWVCAIANNIVLMHIRAKRGQPDLVSEDLLKPAEGGHFTDTLEASLPESDPALIYEAQQLKAEAFASMPAQQTAACRMRLEGYDNGLIAKALNTSEANVRQLIHRSLTYFVTE